MGREADINSIQALEEKIEEHERAIIKLKRARNSLLNVSLLPPEVLGNIFSLNIVIEEPFGGLEKSSHNFLLVCHHWFEVALRTPELWTFWGNNTSDWDRRCLRSSVAMPLDLVLDGLTHTSGEVSERQQRVLKERATRDTIRRIHLLSETPKILTSIISPLLSPSGGLQSRRLESLILCSETPAPLDVSFLIRSNLPKLQHLELDNCTIPSWGHLISQTLLTTLILHLNRIPSAPTMPELLSILASNPHLRTLELCSNALPVNHDQSGFSQVALRHLEELELNGDTRRIFGLLHRLEYPQMVKLTLRLSHCQAADITQTIGPYLREFLRRRGRSRDGLGLDLFAPHGAIVFNLGDPKRFRLSPSIKARMDVFAAIQVELDQVPGNLLDKLSLDLLAQIPRDDVVYFSTTGCLEVVKDLRTQLPNLKTLELLRLPLSAAFPTPDQEPSGAREVFPASLQNIFLGRLFVDAFDWLPLIAYLVRRMASENQLDSLLIDGPCHMCQSVTTKVRGLVRDFEIDDECKKSWCPFGTCA